MATVTDQDEVFEEGLDAAANIPVESHAEKVHRQYDIQKIKTVLQKLPQSERWALEFKFGITTGRPINERQIARKLGRSEFWVEKRLSAGLLHIRQELGVEL